MDGLYAAALVAAVWYAATAVDFSDSGRFALTIAAAVVLVVAWYGGLRTRGTSPAAFLMRVRFTDAATEFPGFSLRKVRAVDLVRGADPMRPGPRPMRLALFRTPETAMIAEDGVVIVLDDGTRYSLRRAAILGRNPAAQAPGDEADTEYVVVSDLSRAMSRSHLHLRPASGAVNATDLGGAAGTWLIVDGSARRLPPNQTVRLEFGAVLRLGGRQLQVRRASESRTRFAELAAHTPVPTATPAPHATSGDAAVPTSRGNQ